MSPFEAGYVPNSGRPGCSAISLVPLQWGHVAQSWHQIQQNFTVCSVMPWQHAPISSSKLLSNIDESFEV